MLKEITQKAKLVTFEGLDGSGKTLQIHRLCKYLNDTGRPTIVFREPGSGDLNEELRRLLLATEKHPLVDALLFNAARMNNIFTNIKPALEDGTNVLMDRFIDSTYVYQAHGTEFVTEILALEDMVTKHVYIDRTFYLDVSIAEANKRINLRPYDEVAGRNDLKTDEWKRNILRGYKYRLNQCAGRMIHINADKPSDDVWHIIKTLADSIFKPAI